MDSSKPPAPSLDDAQRLIARMRPSDRAELRPWILAKFSVRGDIQPGINEEFLTDKDEEHRLRR
jgi:hypothetical protein